MGRFTIGTINRWLTGKDGMRSKNFNFGAYDAWREQYWNDLRTTYTWKMDTWSYEQEYRILRDSQNADADSKAQTYKFELSQLKAFIFGIKTSISDRAVVMSAVQKSYGLLNKVQWKQAEYNEINQNISVTNVSF